MKPPVKLLLTTRAPLPKRTRIAAGCRMRPPSRRAVEMVSRRPAMPGKAGSASNVSMTAYHPIVVNVAWHSHWHSHWHATQRFAVATPGLHARTPAGAYRDAAGYSPRSTPPLALTRLLTVASSHHHAPWDAGLSGKCETGTTAMRGQIHAIMTHPETVVPGRRGDNQIEAEAVQRRQALAAMRQSTPLASSTSAPVARVPMRLNVVVVPASAPITRHASPAPQETIMAARGLGHRIEMVWRQGPGGAESAPTAAPLAASAIAGPTGMVPAVRAAALAAEAAVQPVRHLDPAVADRLAEDVIRRVERQMRIGRERRGL